MTIDGSLKLSRLRPRYFDEVDTVTGTSEADVFEVQPLGQIFFNPIITNEVEPLKYFNPRLVEDETLDPGKGRFLPGRGTASKEQPEFVTQSLDDNFIAMGVPIIVDPPSASELDILVYQEQERDYYLEGFQAPTARSYAYINDFEPIDDQIIVELIKLHIVAH